MRFLILPNQLFDKKYLDKSLHYVIWECPHFFTAYNYNKKKLMLHRASMKYYYDYLKKHNYRVSYIEYNNILEQDESYLLYNPLNKPDILGLPKHYKIYDKPTPSLLLSPTLITEYRKKTKKFFFNAFYMWSKQKLNIIPKIKSQDKMNRSIIKNTPDIKQPFESEQKLNKYIEESIKYVQKHFPNNYGNTDNFIFPITHKDANNWLKHFIKYKSESFGTYQDFIHKDNPYLYHSLLSPLINIGLLTPLDVIKHLNPSIPLNSYEGFIRQLFWREYQYYCYIYYDYSNKNYFNNNKKLTTEWYTGNTGITPIDDAIKEGFNSGYLHHIRRLMVVGNYMNLCQIHPKEGFRWFMEFSCDSYEWVMYQNVYDMVFFVSGGATMRRPYISSSNYIIKMSNYKKDKWCEVWNNKYKQFIIRNKNKLMKFRYYIRLHS
jgi:deoxyribodipyrimidine photolyase-related protein